MPVDVIYQDGNSGLRLSEDHGGVISIADADVSDEEKLAALQNSFDQMISHAQKRRTFLLETCVSFMRKAKTLKVAAVITSAAIPLITALSLSGGIFELSSVALSSSIALSIVSALGVATTVILGIESMFGYQRKAEKAEADMIKTSQRIIEAKAGWLNAFLINDTKSRLIAAASVINVFNTGIEQGPYAKLDSLNFIERYVPEISSRE